VKNEAASGGAFEGDALEGDDFDAELFERLGAAGLLHLGAELFHKGQYHAAHEAWEQSWLAGMDDDEFWKGLIQAAICLHHFERGELDGARKLYQGHRRLLAGFCPEHRELKVEAFLAEMSRCLRPVVRAAPTETVAFDGATAPRLQFL